MIYFVALLLAFFAAIVMVFLAAITIQAIKDPKKNLQGALIIWAVIILTTIIYNLIIGG